MRSASKKSLTEAEAQLGRLFVLLSSEMIRASIIRRDRDRHHVRLLRLP